MLNLEWWSSLAKQVLVFLGITHLSMSWRWWGGGVGRQGMGWGFDCVCWPWGRAFDWSCSPRGGDIWIFLRAMWRYLTADSHKKDWDRICFLLPCFTHAPYGLERSGNHGGQREQAKAEWISLFCLQILFVLACFWSIEPLKILWYQSKRK